MEQEPIQEPKKKKKDKLSREIINIIRTTQRNNIELTNIADNKANVLLSLNAIMITFLLPLVIANMAYILNSLLYIPLIILALTCFITIFISTAVLKPARFEQFRDVEAKRQNYSPFFFGNFYKMDPDDYFRYMEENLRKQENVQFHLAQDMYYVGKRLGKKMMYTRTAFTIFTVGIFLSLASTVLVLVFFA